MGASVSHSLFEEVGRIAARMGYALDPPAGSDPSFLTQRVSLEALRRRLEVLAQQSGDPDIGLRVGRLLSPAALGIPGYLAMAGPTLSAALPRVMTYQRLVADGMEMHVELGAEFARFSIRWGPEPPQRALADLLIAGTRFFGAWLLGDEPPLEDAWFRHSQPAGTNFYRELFGCKPRFGEADDGFALARRFVDATLKTAEASLVPALEAQAMRMLASFREDSFLCGVSEAIVEQIGAGLAVDMVAVAARLHSSPRTFQRRLQVHGTTFNRLLQEVRMELANRFLSDSTLSLHEVSLRVGYQEQSSFCHAYRQWTGRAPSEARRDCHDVGRISPRR